MTQEHICNVSTPLQLRWRNPRPSVIPECENTAPGYVNPFDMTSLDILIKTYRLTIPSKTRDNWRWVFPNTGYLKGFEDVFTCCFIHATDGILAYFRVDDSGSLFLGHLSNFVGPVAKEYVYEEDWDFEKNKRKVNVFKRADGSIVVIPKDTFWEQYWSKNKRMTKAEHEALAHCTSYKEIANVWDHFTNGGPFLGEKVIGKKEKSKRQQLIDSL